MKKLNVILLILSFILSGIGSIFLFDATSSTNDSIQTIAPSNKIDSEEITEWTYKTYEDYFIDNFNIPSEIYTRDEATQSVTIDYTKITKTSSTNEIQMSYNGEVFFTISSSDLTGSGKQNDPYVVHSTNGYYFLFNNEIGSSVYGKYIEFDCDVFLNDEKFDENGIPSGGDGKVYSWTMMTDKSGFYLDGKNHFISGFYFNNENLDSVSMFYSTRDIKNLRIREAFLKGKAYIGMFRNVWNISNIIFESGTVISTSTVGYTGGISYYVSKTVKNCVNYATVDAKSVAGGIVGFVQGASIENCKNYGKVKGNVDVGGIVGLSNKSTIKNCDNYGYIEAITYFSAGIVGWVHLSSEIINCNNYGEIYVSGYDGGACAGILGKADDSIIIYECNNYAKTSNSTVNRSEILGYVQPKDPVNGINIFISNCNGYYGNRFFGASIHSMELPNINIFIDNCYFNTKTKESYIFGTGGTKKVNYFIKNMKVNTLGQSFYITGGGDASTTHIENLLIEGQVNNMVFAKTTEYNIKNMVVNCVNTSGKTNRLYFGTNFSGYYFSWKTGKIGLVAFDGRGSFQGSIDEEWLLNKGYTKKEV